MEASISDDRIKELFKSAILEVLEERGDLLREALAEAIEEIARLGVDYTIHYNAFRRINLHIAR